MSKHLFPPPSPQPTRAKISTCRRLSCRSMEPYTKCSEKRRNSEHFQASLQATQSWTLAEFIDPWLGDKVNSGIGLSCRPASLPVRQPYAGVDFIPRSGIYKFGYWWLPHSWRQYWSQAGGVEHNRIQTLPERPHRGPLEVPLQVTQGSNSALHGIGNVPGTLQTKLKERTKIINKFLQSWPEDQR